MSQHSQSHDFLEYWKAVKPQLDEGCQSWIPLFARDLPPQQWTSIDHALDAGKRIRGCLVCLTSQALGGGIEEAIPRAVAIECIQAASLIHDDYVDQDRVRRHRPAVWTLEGSRRAVLLGDVIFASTIQRCMAMSPADGLAITEAIAIMAKGAYQEPLDARTLIHALSEGTYRADLYDHVIRLKTGILFGTAARLGALAAEATKEQTLNAFEFGARVGEAYQIADDLHEVLGLDEDVAGLAPRMVKLAPVFLYFWPEGHAQLLHMLAGRVTRELDWVARVIPMVTTRMRQATQDRLDLALKEIDTFPHNSYTQLLRTAPFDIVRMQESPATRTHP